MKYKVTIFAFILFLSFPGYAQKDLSPGFSIGFNVLRTNIHTEPLNQFAHSFNAYHQGSGFVSFKDFKNSLWAPGFNLRIRGIQLANSVALDASFMYSWDKQSNSTTLVQKSGYDLFYKSRNLDFYGDLGYDIKGYVVVGASLGIGMGFQAIEIWKTYPNGDRSITNENDLPGHYVGMAAPISGGVFVMPRLLQGRILVPVRLSYAIPLLKNNGLHFSDFSNHNRFRDNQIPLDYDEWVINKPEIHHSGRFLQADLRLGWRFQIGVEYVLNFKKEK